MADNTVHEIHHGDGSAGWIALVAVLIALLIIGGLYLYNSGSFAGGGDSDSINIELPNGSLPDGGSGDAE